MSRGWLMWCVVLCCGGCDSLRLAPSEAMKGNAWMHHRTTQLAADAAQDAEAGWPLEGLTALAAMQSGAFVTDYGLPRELPAATTAEEVLAGSAHALATTATTEARQRPDAWETADAVLELGIGIAGVLGGAWGLRIGQLLRRAREKSRALEEIVAGNELFKRQNAAATEAFKQAQAGQSAATRRLVAELK
ncbi:MAG TPA: hypothetical protein ENN87_06405 [Phycisphaerales bacterium]|nr:hypothetical protein [Phycisphaerales bacterium]